MKGIFAVILLAVGFLPVIAQNEQSPMTQKVFDYKDWTYKNVRADGTTDLRDAIQGKKLVMVVYFAPWCPNWKHDAPFVESLYEKYKDNGLGVVAVGEYDPAAAMKTNLDELKITFPAVYESEARTARDTTTHFSLRGQTGDTRRWGSPWYVFLEPASFEKKGDIITKQANVVNGELVRDEAEKFIRSKLGLPPEPVKTGVSAKSTIDVCDPEKSTLTLKKP